MTTIAQSLGGRKWKYAALMFFHCMRGGITSLEGRLISYVCKNPKAIAKITQQRVLANKPTKELKRNKHIQLIQIFNPKNDRKKGKQGQRTNGTNRKQMEKW